MSKKKFLDEKPKMTKKIPLKFSKSQKRQKFDDFSKKYFEKKFSKFFIS